MHIRFLWRVYLCKSASSNPVTSEEKKIMIERMLALQEEISEEVEKPSLDPGRLMRLTAAATGQCVVALAALLEDRRSRLAEKAEKTRVDFFTMVRGEDE